MTVTLVGDTSGVDQPFPEDLPELFGNRGTATIAIAGLGTATFNDPDGYAAVVFPVVDEILVPSVGIWQGFDPEAGKGTGILGIGSDSLAGYNLQSALGPLSGVSGRTTARPTPRSIWHVAVFKV